MEGVVCAHCFTYLASILNTCPTCGQKLIADTANKTIIDKITPNCLVHRYEGSDLLEPAIIVKEGKVNYKVATKLKEYQFPIIIPKSKVYMFDLNLLSAIQALRNERTATMYRYDHLIQTHWQQLKPFKP